MIVLNSTGEAEREYTSGAGVIQATQNPWNPKGTGACENVAWLISGTDEDSIKSAVKALALHHNELRYAFGAVVQEGRIIKVP
jgi:hypothetical protein